MAEVNDMTDATKKTSILNERSEMCGRLVELERVVRRTTPDELVSYLYSLSVLAGIRTSDGDNSIERINDHNKRVQKATKDLEKAFIERAEVTQNVIAGISDKVSSNNIQDAWDELETP